MHRRCLIHAFWVPVIGPFSDHYRTCWGISQLHSSSREIRYSSIYICLKNKLNVISFCISISFFSMFIFLIPFYITTSALPPTPPPACPCLPPSLTSSTTSKVKTSHGVSTKPDTVLWGRTKHLQLNGLQQAGSCTRNRCWSHCLLHLRPNYTAVFHKPGLCNLHNPQHSFFFLPACLCVLLRTPQTIPLFKLACLLVLFLNIRP